MCLALFNTRIDSYFGDILQEKYRFKPKQQLSFNLFAQVYALFPSFKTIYFKGNSDRLWWINPHNDSFPP